VPLALGIRLALVCFTMTIGWIAASPRAPGQRIGLPGTLAPRPRRVADDAARQLSPTCRSSAGRRARSGSRAGRRAADPALPRLHDQSRLFPAARPRLEAAGIGPILVPNFRAVFSNIETYADELEVAIERVATQSGHGRVSSSATAWAGSRAEYLRRRGERASRGS
jgi:hypothetical protein